MSEKDFVKGECRHCGGHLEFPADAAGEAIPCPHCGQMTELRGTGPGVKRWRLAAIIALAGGLVVVVAALMGQRPHPTVTIPTAAATATNHLPATTTVPGDTNTVVAKAPNDEPRPGETVTNHFGIAGGTMQKTAGSSLVYVVGSVRNLSDRQRFGVKVDYTLMDIGGQIIGHATDYQPEIDPHAEWDFKALVMESKADSAQFNRITEQ